jgi:RNA 3'-terminal phosphate cyclase (ATP)
VAERELEVIRTELGIPPARTRHVTLRSPGPGNVVCVRVGELELVSAFGERGLRAETVARTAADQVKGYLQARAPVGEHLADQLILPFALCGGAYRSAPLSSHATTNVAVLRQFLGERAVSVHEEANAVRLTFPGRQGT